MSHTEIIHLWNESKNKQDFKTKLKEQGFVTIGSGRRSVVFSKPKLDFVVKVASAGGVATRAFREPEIEKYRLPYLYVNGNRHIAIQPKVNCSKKNKYRAWDRIQGETSVELYIYDINQENVGMRKNKPVIFDYK